MNRLTAFVVGILLVVAPAAGSAETVSHSGTITAVDRNAGTLELGEIGPWQVRDGATVVTRHRIAVTPFTSFVRAWRVAEAVLCQHDGTFLTALEIVVTELEDR